MHDVALVVLVSLFVLFVGDVLAVEAMTIQFLRTKMQSPWRMMLRVLLLRLSVRFSYFAVVVELLIILSTLL